MNEVKYCGCKGGDAAAFQSKVYGPGKRVHNRTKQNKPESEREWRCTCCGKERD